MPRLIAYVVALCLAAALSGRVCAAEESNVQTPPEQDRKLDSSATPPPTPEEKALREVVKSLAKALQEGNRDGIRHAMYAANPTEQKMLEAMAAMAAQIAELNRTASKAFGDEQAKSLTGDVAMEMRRIDEAEVSIEGEIATVRYSSPTDPPPEAPASDPPPAAPEVPDDADSDTPPPPPMVLKKIDGRWRVPVAELSKDTTPAEIEQRLTDLDVQRKIIAELTGEIAQGKYKSAEKAAEAWQGKMMQALLPKKPDPEQKPDEEKKPEPAKQD